MIFKAKWHGNREISRKLGMVFEAKWHKNRFFWKVGHSFRGKLWHRNREISGKDKSDFSAENVNLIFFFYAKINKELSPNRFSLRGFPWVKLTKNSCVNFYVNAGLYFRL